MAVVEVIYEDIRKLTGLPESKVMEGLTLLGAPAEKDQGRILVEVMPNRPDLFSVEGISRALNAFYKGKTREYKIKKTSGYKLIVGSVPFRQHAAWALARNLKFDDQKIKDIIQLQDKLNATLGRRVKKFGIGFYPLQNIAFPIKYVLMDPTEIVFHPLNYPTTTNSVEILEKHPKGLEHGHLLRGQKKYPVYIDAKDRIMGLIPIVNSAELGRVGTTTTEMLVEVTGIDHVAVNTALNIICCGLIDVGGVIESIDVVCGKKKEVTPNLTEQKISLDLKFVGRALGREFKSTEVKRLLKRMGYGMVGGEVCVPPYRSDVLGVIDVVEDIAIAYGYNNFKMTLPNFFSIGNRNRKYDVIKEGLSSLGFLEMNSFTLTNKESAEKLKYIDCLPVLNPVSEDSGIVRPGLVLNVLETFSNNKMKGIPQKIYEVGDVFSEGRVRNKVVFALMTKDVDFPLFRGYLQSFSKKLDLTLELKKQEGRWVVLDSKYSGVVFINGKKVGCVGLVKGEFCDMFGIVFDVFVCELEADSLVR